MFLIGRFFGAGSVMKFNKNSFAIDWRTHFNFTGNDPSGTSYNEHDAPIHDIISYVQPKYQEFIYGCGFAFKDATSDSIERKAAVFKMDTGSGAVSFIKQWGQELVSDSDADSDHCKSIYYDEVKHELIIALEAVSADLRPSIQRYQTWSQKRADTVIIKMYDDGAILSAVNINNNDASVGMFITEDSLFSHKGKLIWAGQQYGYKTKFQNVTFSTTSPTYDMLLWN